MLYRSWPSISADGRIFQTLSPSFFNYLTILPDQLPPKISCKYFIPDRPLPAAPGSSVVANAGAAAATYISSWFSGETAKKWEPVSLDDIRTCLFQRRLYEDYHSKLLPVQWADQSDRHQNLLDWTWQNQKGHLLRKEVHQVLVRGLSFRQPVNGLVKIESKK